MTNYSVSGESAPYIISDGTQTQTAGDIAAVVAWLAPRLKFTYPTPPTEDNPFGQTVSGDTVAWRAGEPSTVPTVRYDVAYGPGQVEVWLNGQATSYGTFDTQTGGFDEALTRVLTLLLPKLNNGDSLSLGTEE